MIYEVVAAEIVKSNPSDVQAMILPWDTDGDLRVDSVVGLMKQRSAALFSKTWGR